MIRHAIQCAGASFTNRAVVNMPTAGAQHRQSATRQSPACAQFQNSEWPIGRPSLGKGADPGQKRSGQGLLCPTLGGWWRR